MSTLLQTFAKTLYRSTFANMKKAIQNLILPRKAVTNYSTRQIDETWYLGSNLYATAFKEYPLLDLRHYWKPNPNGNMVSTTKGVKLNRQKLENLKNATLAIQDFIPKGSAEYPCLPSLNTRYIVRGIFYIIQCEGW